MMRFDYIQSARPSLFMMLGRAGRASLFVIGALAVGTAVTFLGWNVQPRHPLSAPRRDRPHRRDRVPSRPRFFEQKVIATRIHVVRAYISSPKAIPRRAAQHAAPLHRDARALRPRKSPAGAENNVLAVVVGERPQAIVERSGRTQVVTVGDVVSGRKIVAILFDGVRFEDGSLRRVAVQRR